MIPRYTRAEMGALWSDQRRYELMLEIEVAVCAALARRGAIPSEAVAEIRAKAKVNADRIAEIEAVVHHDVIAFVTAVAETVGDAGRFLHFGMTSSDVVDTAFALQLVEASKILLKTLEGLKAAVRKQVDAHRETVMVGRSHGIHAQPITFGLKLAGWFAELTRSQARLEQAAREIAFGKLSGAVGSYGVNGPDIEAEVLSELGLAPEPVATQVVPRDRHAAFFATLAVVAGGIERFATEIRHLQRTELLEALEPFGKGQKGSSAMPHKRNPILSENLCGLARVVRANAMVALENIALWHERDISHSSAERVIAPDSTIALDFMLARMTGIVSGLEVRPANMKRNLDLTGGRLASERLLLSLVDKGLAREVAYGWVQRCALAEGDFRAMVAEDPDISAHLSRGEIEDSFDVRHALAHVAGIIDRGLQEDPS
ncbi:MAG TPA: adenylosuccinate lyase [Candidatus Limnocylindrales bacterium]|nr:adenylosuccinate lyase [Candidatus Limnocylindrales bacterium]